MIIVAGHLLVSPEERERYIQGCVSVVEQARSSPGCLDFAITADLVGSRPHRHPRTVGVAGGR